MVSDLFIDQFPNELKTHLKTAKTECLFYFTGQLSNLPQIHSVEDRTNIVCFNY